MNDHDLEQRGDDYRCRVCGREWIKPVLPIYSRCDGRRQEAGDRRQPPRRSETTVETLLKICRTNDCQRFDAGADACRSCGCASTRGSIFRRRVRDAEWHCPVGLW